MADSDFEPARKNKHIAFWILFPISALLLGALLLFYLELANGPFYLLILSGFAWAGLVVASICLIGKKKRWRIIPWGAFFVTVALVAPLAKPAVVSFPAVTHENPIATESLHLRDGDVRGVYSQDGQVEVYTGIPYALPPIGQNRWKEPQDPLPWSGVRNCSYFAPKSMQKDSFSVVDSLVDLYAEGSWHPDFSEGKVQNKSEDSLYLNIWRPANTNPGDDLPILVYIHGGSLTSGSAAFSDYNGEALAHKGIIVITIGYRLGVFGFFAHDLLELESPNHTTGNYGLLDQIKALQWIQENAPLFGGGKTKVTIAGESAGSSCVSALCSSPLATGLFRYAIGESSSLVTKIAPHTFRPLGAAKIMGQRIMEEQGCSTLEELRNVPADQLVNTKYTNSAMTIEPYALPKEPYQVYLEGGNNETALLNGFNVKEADAFIVPQYLLSPTNAGNIQGRLLQLFDEPTTDKIMALYDERIRLDAFASLNEIASVYWFMQPHQSWTHMAQQNGVPVYRYQFTKDNGYYGTYHSGELIYAYGNLGRSKRQFAYDASDYALSNVMSEYWANFVKTGDPNGTGLPTWDIYDESSGEILELGSSIGPKVDPYLALYPIIEEYQSSGKALIDWANRGL